MNLKLSSTYKGITFSTRHKSKGTVISGGSSARDDEKYDSGEWNWYFENDKNMIEKCDDWLCQQLRYARVNSAIKYKVNEWTYTSIKLSNVKAVQTNDKTSRTRTLTLRMSKEKEFAPPAPPIPNVAPNAMAANTANTVNTVNTANTGANGVNGVSTGVNTSVNATVNSSTTANTNTNSTSVALPSGAVVTNGNNNNMNNNNNNNSSTYSNSSSDDDDDEGKDDQKQSQAQTSVGPVNGSNDKMNHNDKNNNDSDKKGKFNEKLLKYLSEEMSKVEALFRLTMEKTKFSIVSLERINFDESEQSKSQLIMYNQLLKSKISQLLKRNKHMTKDSAKSTIQRQLFHGTQRDVIIKIKNNGFNRDFNTRAMYGTGTYFARDARYSHHYCSSNDSGEYCMLLCNVIVGEYCQGDMSMKTPPFKSDGLTQYDSLVNDTNNPAIFVISRDYHCIPSYLIRYKINKTR